jgi:hypothetical protein
MERTAGDAASLEEQRVAGLQCNAVVREKWAVGGQTAVCIVSVLGINIIYCHKNNHGFRLRKPSFLGELWLVLRSKIFARSAKKAAKTA